MAREKMYKPEQKNQKKHLQDRKRPAILRNGIFGKEEMRWRKCIMAIWTI
jgi:hypothetical protein